VAMFISMEAQDSDAKRHVGESPNRMKEGQVSPAALELIG